MSEMRRVSVLQESVDEIGIRKKKNPGRLLCIKELGYISDHFRDFLLHT